MILNISNQGVYGIKGKIQSSWDQIRDVRVIAKHAVNKLVDRATLEEKVRKILIGFNMVLLIYKCL